MFAEDMIHFFDNDEFAVSATFGTETANVLFDCPEVIFADNVVSGDYKITYPTGLFSGLKYRSNIIVDGVSYTVNHVNAVSDGKLTQAILSKNE